MFVFFLFVWLVTGGDPNPDGDSSQSGQGQLYSQASQINWAGTPQGRGKNANGRAGKQRRRELDDDDDRVLPVPAQVPVPSAQFSYAYYVPPPPPTPAPATAYSYYVPSPTPRYQVPPTPFYYYPQPTPPRTNPQPTPQWNNPQPTPQWASPTEVPADYYYYDYPTPAPPTPWPTNPPTRRVRPAQPTPQAVQPTSTTRVLAPSVVVPAPAPPSSASSPTSTASSPTSTASSPTSTASSPTSTASSPTSTASSPTSTASSPTTSASSPTSSASSPTTAASSPTTAASSPTTAASSPTVAASSPTSSASSPTSAASSPTTSASSPTTSASSPTSSASSPTPTTSRSSPTPASSPTSSASSPTSSASSPTTSDSSPTSASSPTSVFSPTPPRVPPPRPEGLNVVSVAPGNVCRSVRRTLTVGGRGFSRTADTNMTCIFTPACEDDPSFMDSRRRTCSDYAGSCPQTVAPRCPRTCGVCPLTLNTCADQPQFFRQCESMRANGQCENATLDMLEICPLSCGWCGVVRARVLNDTALVCQTPVLGLVGHFNVEVSRDARAYTRDSNVVISSYECRDSERSDPRNPFGLVVQSLTTAFDPLATGVKLDFEVRNSGQADLPAVTLFLRSPAPLGASPVTGAATTTAAPTTSGSFRSITIPSSGRAFVLQSVPCVSRLAINETAVCSIVRDVSAGERNDGSLRGVAWAETKFVNSSEVSFDVAKSNATSMQVSGSATQPMNCPTWSYRTCIPWWAWLILALLLLLLAFLCCAAWAYALQNRNKSTSKGSKNYAYKRPALHNSTAASAAVPAAVPDPPSNVPPHEDDGRTARIAYDGTLNKQSSESTLIRYPVAAEPPTHEVRLAFYGTRTLDREPSDGSVLISHPVPSPVVPPDHADPEVRLAYNTGKSDQAIPPEPELDERDHLVYDLEDRPSMSYSEAPRASVSQPRVPGGTLTTASHGSAHVTYNKPEGTTVFRG